MRGRVFDESKPETFNQLWTIEEQRRLEELLIEYPPEEIEMRRWTKIANALGMIIINRHNYKLKKKQMSLCEKKNINIFFLQEIEHLSKYLAESKNILLNF